MVTNPTTTSLGPFKSTSKPDWTFVKTFSSGATVKDINTFLAERNYTNGSGNNQADELWHDRRSVSPSTTADLLDLHGTLLNGFGDTVDFKAIKEFWIWNRGVEDPTGTFTPTDGEDLLIGGAAANPWTSWINGGATDKVRIRSGGLLHLSAPMDGFGVGAGDGDILQVAWDGSVASGGDIGYDILLAGVSW